MRDAPQRALHAAITRLLRPLVRFLLRNGVPFGVFAELAKSAYVDVASGEFTLPGRKQTHSRISLLTGLTRKEVLRLKRLPPLEDGTDHERYCRGTRIIAGWIRDKAFLDTKGRPDALPVEGKRASFTELVRRYGSDVPVRAVLDELQRVGSVQLRDDGRVELMTRAYIPQAGDTEKLEILGTDVGDLIATIDHNLGCQAGEARFQRKVEHINFPVDELPQFQRKFSGKAQALLESLDEWMGERIQAREDPDAPRIRAGLGIYYFQQQDDEEEK